jgi:uncharacterized membrane protein YphA (DoxX/SURF4 family)
MENYNKIWRFFFAIMLIAIAVQQLIVADFRPVILPYAYPAWLPGRLIWTWIISITLIMACLAIIVEIKARSISIIMGVIFILFLLLLHIPYYASINPQFLGAWGNAFKMLVLSGGSFIVAGSFPKERNAPGFIKQAEKLIPLGKYFFCTTIIVFGVEHFMYKTFVATLVPDWIPGHLFWTYFAGAALILSGLAIVLNIKARQAAFLLGLMIFLWFLILHIPRGIAYPSTDHGNEWTSVFESLGFSGIAFILAGKPKKNF